MTSRGGDFKLLAAMVCMSMLPGCAGRSLSRVGGTNELPKDLPRELQEKFEVREVPAVVKTPLPFPSPVPVSARVVKSKKKSRMTSIPAPPVKPFAYPNRRSVKDPIWQSETQIFEITYFGMAAGTFTLEVLPPKVVADRKVYHIKGTAVSSKVFSLFYSVNDYVESFFDYEGLFSHRFHLVLDESKQARDALELNDSEKSQTYYWNRWDHKDKGYVETKEFSPIQPFSQDSLSALFYLRTMDLQDGKVITFPVVSEGKTWEAVVTVMRREMIDSPLGKVRAIVLKPETKFHGVLQKRGDSFMWLTDDDRRFLVRLEAKVKIGTVLADLKKVVIGEPPQ